MPDANGNLLDLDLLVNLNKTAPRFDMEDKGDSYLKGLGARRSRED